ncbi:hypothetical protein A4H97_11785 [Niastella yeongjuensis]|uniref:Uncharacterized protein n=1 Tax=Niastella yeongjuensis TaxID=354355 RepID=A0A1V9E9S1_9BACT|nr:hypothetical protein [Niastella yeongjuensis]OQP42832.1 hypothetical protein A4H97_11785 [Niastella yeongjuensis]SEO55963.1 hypothetical protein SAMN05660816_03023 [Niastella yeongjuensis]
MVRLFNSQKFSLIHLLVFLLLLGNIGCQKEMSKDTLGAGGVVGGGGGGNTTGGTAVFTLEPAGSRCSDAAVTGIFEAGTTLGADALITVTVNVTKIGDWTYATAATNGFSFAGAGNFTATGLQVITLMGVGKPTRSGIFSFHLKIGTGADCAVAVGVVPAGTGGGTGGNTPNSFYYKATIDGTNYNVNITATTTDYEPGVSMGGSDDVVFGGGITWANPPLPAGKTEFGITKGIMHQYMSATTAQFKAFFKPATYLYTADASATDGITISWTDPSGNAGTSGTDNIWNSDAGSKDQTNSAFTILSNTEYIDVAGDYYVIVKAQFNCNLYNVTTGAKKVLTNGEAVVAFGMF